MAFDIAAKKALNITPKRWLRGVCYHKDMIDYSSPVGRVRLLIPDTTLLEDPRDLRAEKRYLFEDEQIEALLEMCAGNIKLAAADAIDIIGTDVGLQMLVITTDDKSTDGSKMLNSMLARGRQLRNQAKEEITDAIVFDVVDPTFEPVDPAWRM